MQEPDKFLGGLKPSLERAMTTVKILKLRTYENYNCKYLKIWKVLSDRSLCLCISVLKLLWLKGNGNQKENLKDESLSELSKSEGINEKKRMDGWMTEWTDGFEQMKKMKRMNEWMDGFEQMNKWRKSEYVETMNEWMNEQ